MKYFFFHDVFLSSKVLFIFVYLKFHFSVPEKISKETVAVRNVC